MKCFYKTNFQVFGQEKQERQASKYLIPKRLKLYASDFTEGFKNQPDTINPFPLLKILLKNTIKMKTDQLRSNTLQR